jgi:hypothetical protein
MKIRAVGCGGVGLSLIEPLCRYVSYHPDLREDDLEVSLIDGDEYEERNRERQNFDRIGNKSEVSCERYQKMFPNIYFRPHTDYLSEDNVILAIQEGDVVFCCVDNHATRKLISDRCEELDNVLLISGGNEYDDGNVQIHCRVDGEDLTLPIANDYHPEIQEPEDENPADVEREGGCDVEVVSEPQLVIANNAVAAAMLNAFYRYMEKKQMPDEVYLDMKTNKSRVVYRLHDLEEQDDDALKSMCDEFLGHLDESNVDPDFRDSFKSLMIRFTA